MTPTIQICSKTSHLMHKGDNIETQALLIVFFDFNGMVHSEFLPESCTLKNKSILLLMRRVRGAIRRKTPDLWQNHSRPLHHNNGPSHTSLLVYDWSNTTLIMTRPPYSPGLDPRDFLLFPKLKKGRFVMFE